MRPDRSLDLADPFLSLVQVAGLQMERFVVDGDRECDVVLVVVADVGVFESDAAASLAFGHVLFGCVVGEQAVELVEDEPAKLPPVDDVSPFG